MDEKQNEILELRELADALSASGKTVNSLLVRDAANRLERLSRECRLRAQETSEAEQIAGKALGYPWFKDDRKNFPGATEENGVCVGEHVLGSIVQELADRYKAQAERLSGLRERLEGEMARWKGVDDAGEEYGDGVAKGVEIALGFLTTPPSPSPVDASLKALEEPVEGMRIVGEGFAFRFAVVPFLSAEPLWCAQNEHGDGYDANLVRALKALVKHNAASVELPDALPKEQLWEDVWTDEEVAAQNLHQSDPKYHPLTCGGNRGDKNHRDFQAQNGGDFGQLVATRKGWVCPVPGCGYKQGWRAALPKEGL